MTLGERQNPHDANALSRPHDGLYAAALCFSLGQYRGRPPRLCRFLRLRPSCRDLFFEPARSTKTDFGAFLSTWLLAACPGFINGAVLYMGMGVSVPALGMTGLCLFLLYADKRKPWMAYAGCACLGWALASLSWFLAFLCGLALCGAIFHRKFVETSSRQGIRKTAEFPAGLPRGISFPLSAGFDLQHRQRIPQPPFHRRDIAARNCLGTRAALYSRFQHSQPATHGSLRSFQSTWLAALWRGTVGRRDFNGIQGRYWRSAAAGVNAMDYWPGRVRRFAVKPDLRESGALIRRVPLDFCRPRIAGFR